MRWLLRIVFAFPLLALFLAGSWIIGLALILLDVLTDQPQQYRASRQEIEEYEQSCVWNRESP